MEKENELENGEAKSEASLDERLNKLAEKRGITADELLISLEEKQAVLEEHSAVTNQSIGSQCKNAQDIFDPAGTEFLKGLWGK